MNELKLLLKKDLLIFKNNILLILRNPLRLIPYGMVLAYFGFMYSRRFSGSSSGNQELDIDSVGSVDYALQNVVGGATLLALAFFIFQLYRATKKNVTFFKMADVNLLFTAPVKPENLLIYYMGRSILPALGGSIFFLMYSGGQFAKDFDISLGGGVFLVLGFAFYIFMIFPLRFLIYTLHTHFGIMNYIQGTILTLGAVLTGMILIPGFQGEKFWQGMFSWIASPWFDLFPVVGWARGMMSYSIQGNLILALGYLTLFILSYYSVVKLVIRYSGYYYEDVLESTKSNEEKLEKALGKREVTEDTYSLNAKKQLALPEFGVGAKAFYWRNYVHSSRQDFHPLVGIYSLGMALLGILFSGLSHLDWFSHKVLYFYFTFLMFFWFMAGIGRANLGDFKKPWFFLVPASWSAKFWNLIKLDLLQTFLFSFLLIIPSVLIAQLSFWLILLFPLGMNVFYLIGLAVNLIPQIGLDEGWDRILIKPLMIGGIFLFGLIPAIVLALFLFLVTDQFAWGLAGLILGVSFVAGILIHVTLDILKRLEFKEL